MTSAGGLIFGFQDMLTEIGAMSRLASKFIAPNSYRVLDQLATELEGIRSSASVATRQWGIHNNGPLTTVVSKGGYQSGAKGEHSVFAEITSVWEIQRIPSKKRSIAATHFELVGKTSTRVRLVEKINDVRQELAMWRFEAGDSQSPGCHFHVQILGEYPECPFPHSLDVPRLPSFLLTPAAVVEYVLNELFQESWTKHLANSTAELNRWAPIQKRHLRSLFAWQYNLVDKCAGSPWMELKLAKPLPKLFVDNSGIAAPPAR